MKRIVWVLVNLLVVNLCIAAPIINFKISKPLCLLTFLEAVSDNNHISPTLKQYINDRLHGTDSITVKKAAKAFSSLSLNDSYILSQYPTQRQKPKKKDNLVKIAAVQADSIQGFYDRIIGILPNEQWLLLKQIMTNVEPIYDKILWQQYGSILDGQLTSLRQYGTETDTAFVKLKKFYGSTWPDDMPFTVAVYPIPGNAGNSTATPHNNSLVMSVLSGEKDYDVRIGVTMHEICHVLYEEQPLKRQWEIDSFFNSNPSLSAQYAYNYLDEALATACGNGWIYETISGKTDTGSWYNDAYINKYAHALFPVVKDYLAQDKSIDALFISTAVKLFEQQFPSAAYEYDNLFNRLYFYTDAENDEQYRGIMKTLNKYYRVSSSHSSYPINDERSLDIAGNAKGTQLFIIHTRHKENLETLKKIFPQLNKAKDNDEAIISFIDNNKRPVVVVNVKNQERIAEAFKKMKALKSIKPALDVVKIN